MTNFLFASTITSDIHHHHELCTGENSLWGCVGFSSDCIQNKDCLILAAYQTQTPFGDVVFKLHGKIGPEEYVALAISEDDKMGDDAVIVCYNSVTRSRGIAVSWNYASKRSEVIYPKSDTEHNLDDFVKHVSSNYEDGVLECEFTLRKKTRVPKPDGSNGINYDLSQPYFLQLAKGPLIRKKDKNHIKLEYHEKRMTTEEKVFLNRTYNPRVTNGYKRTLVKIHASLMVVGWMFFAEIGTFTAGYLRTRFTENAGVYWFHIHTVTMSATWVLSMSSVLVMFIGCGFDAFASERLNRNPHAAVGLAAIILTFIQPIMGFLRPDPYSSKRRIFKYIHTTIGYLATTLSLIAILLASVLQEALLMKQAIVISGCFVGLWCCGHVFLSAVKQRGLTDGVTIGYFLGIGGFFSFMIAFLIIIFIS